MENHEHTTNEVLRTPIPTMFRLPRNLQDWPWPRQINPHYEEIKGKSIAWSLTFPEVDAKMAETLTKVAGDLLVALTYPTASKEVLSVGADLMALFFIIDSYTDPLDMTLTREAIDIITDAIRNPNKVRPTGELFIGTVAQQFMTRLVEVASVTAQRHFIDHFSGYLEAVVEQAHDRQTQNIPSIDNYLSVRRRDIGAYPCFAFAESDFELPDEVYYHPVVVELSRLTAELILLDNDLHSYNKEQAAEEAPYNILTVLMHRNNDYSVQQAMEKTAEMCQERKTRFLELWNELPSWDPVIEPIAKKYAQGLADWVGGSHYWQFECQRYFGSAGKHVFETGMVIWMPKFNPQAIAVKSQC